MRLQTTPKAAMRLAVLASLFVTLGAISRDALGAVTRLGPLPYLSAADSPLVGDPTLVTTIEDFEDGVFNLPGVVNVPIPPAPINTTGDGIGTVVGPGPETDSVDADDGAIDGSGTAGHSFRSNRFFNFTVEESVISFILSPDIHGNYPVAFGLVWTDGQQGVVFEGGGSEIDGTRFNLGSPELLGDMTFTGGTAEDRFIGAWSNVGLKDITIGVIKFAGQFMTGLDYFEMDHLQVSYPAVPEPSAIYSAIAATGLVALGRRRPFRGF